MGKTFFFRPMAAFVTFSFSQIFYSVYDFKFLYKRIK